MPRQESVISRDSRTQQRNHGTAGVTRPHTISGSGSDRIRHFSASTFSPLLHCGEDRLIALDSSTRICTEETSEGLGVVIEINPALTAVQWGLLYSIEF